MQLIPTQLTIIEIVIPLILAAVAIVALVLTIKLKARVVNLEGALNEERRRMAELHTFLERVSRTNTTQPEMDMAADPYAAGAYAAGGSAPVSGMVQSQTAQGGAMAGYDPYAMPASEPVRVPMTPPQSASFPAATQQAAYDPQAMRAQEHQTAQQQALEYAKYQERMQAHADQLQQQAMMPVQPAASRAQRQTQPVPPR